MDLHIRRADEADLDAVVELLNFLHDPPTAVADAETWKDILSQSGRVVLVAEDGDRVVGTADMLIVPNLTHGARIWISVENFVVAPDHRRRGVGRALVHAIEEFARSLRSYKLQLVSRQDRADAHAFYSALGFEASAEGFRKQLPDEWNTDPAAWVHRERHGLPF